MNIVEYLIRTALCLIGFYMTYRVLLHNKCHFTVNRFYLLGSFLVSFFIPLFTIDLSLIKIPVIPAVENTFPQGVDAIFTGDMPLIADASVSDDQSGISVLLLVSLVYFTGLLVFLVRYGLDLLRIILLIKKNSTQKHQNYTLVRLRYPVAPFSFFRYVFAYDMDITSADFREYIIKHELAHIRNCHSLDSLFLGLGQVIQWFNPVTLFYKKAVTALHEFSADRAVIENSKTIDGYQQKILKYAYINNHVAFTSSLSNTMIKKRFTMMTKQNQGRHTTFRIMASVIAAAFLLLAFSSGDKIGIKSFPDRMNLVPSLAGPDNNAIPVVNPVPDTSLHSAADQTVSGNIQNKEEEEEMRILNEELDRMRDKDHTDSLSRLPHAEFFMDPENSGRHIAEMQREIAERQLRNAERQLRHAEEQQMLAERLRPLIIDCPIPPDPELLRKMAEAQARLGHIRPMTEENFIFPPLVYPFHFDGNYPDLQELNSRIEEQLKNPELRHIIEHESLRSLEEKDLKMLEEQKEWQEKYRREMEKQRDQMEKTRRQLLDEYQQIMKKYRKESGIN